MPGELFAIEQTRDFLGLLRDAFLGLKLVFSASELSFCLRILVMDDRDLLGVVFFNFFFLTFRLFFVFFTATCSVLDEGSRLICNFHSRNSSSIFWYFILPFITPKNPMKTVRAISNDTSVIPNLIRER